MRAALVLSFAALSSAMADDASVRRQLGFPTAAAAAPLLEQLTGPSGKGAWISGGGTCRRPDLSFARGAMGLTIRFAQSDEDGSSSGFSTADAEGDPASFTLRFQSIDAETLQLSQQRWTGQVDGARLTLTGADGARRVYTRCDGDAPARNWELE